ncbi:MAG: phytoene desaturase family protein [Acidimicrobiales bacterium]
MSDAVVIGAGPNGLVAANLLIDAGWEVTVLESNAQPGGAVMSRDDVFDGAVIDVCSGFYPLAVVSRAIQTLDLERYGLRWCHAPIVLAHPLEDGSCPVLSRDLDETAASMDALERGDGDAWRRLYGLWDKVGDPLLDALFTPFPPAVVGAQLAARLRMAGVLRLARFGILPVRRLLEEEFSGPGGLILAGCALHADLAPESAGSGFFGWILAMLGQQHGWPVVQGGAGRLAGALATRLIENGGILRCNERATSVVIRKGRAVAVRTSLGEEVVACRAVLADVVAPVLYDELLAGEDIGASTADDLRRFQWDWATFKVDWLLDGEIPWRAPSADRAGTVHLGATLDELTAFSAQLAMGRVPDNPFLLLGQMNTADPTRSPTGTSTIWGYTHVPRAVRGDAGDAGLTGSWDSSEVQVLADRIENKIERFAPGFRGRITARSVLSPRDLESHDANLVGGGINGGTAALHQQLCFRPYPGLGRPETPIPGLYLASSSAHPGGGVHGACGANAARAALRAQTPAGKLGGAFLRWARQRASAGGEIARSWSPSEPGAQAR